MTATHIQIAMGEPVQNQITAESFAMAVKKYQWYPYDAKHKGLLSQALQGCSLPYDGVVKDVLIKMYRGKTVLRVAASEGHSDIITAVLALVPEKDRSKLLYIREKLGRYTSLYCHKRWNTPLHDAVTAKNNAVYTVDAILSSLTPKEQLELLCTSNDLARTPHDIAEHKALGSVKKKLEEYAGQLSQQIEGLEKDAADWRTKAAENKTGAEMWKKIAKDKEGQLKKEFEDKLENLERENRQLKEEKNELQKKFNDQQERFGQEKAELKQLYEQQIKELEEKHREKMDEMCEMYEQQKAEIRNEFEQRTTEQTREIDVRYNRMDTEIDQMKTMMKKMFQQQVDNKVKNNIASHEKQLNNITSDKNAIDKLVD